MLGEKTSGAARLGHRQILTIALPIVFSNVTTPLIGAVDTAVLGQLGAPHYIGAVAVGAVIFSTIYWAFGFLRMGTTGLAAQSEGRREADESAAILWRALIIAGLGGCALVLLQLPIAWTAIYLVPGSQEVEEGARLYFDIRIWSAPAALANYALFGWFIGLGRAGTAFSLQLLLNGTNLLLDVIFVLGFGWEIEGVALGTLMAEVLAAGVGIWLAVRIMKRRSAWANWQLIADRSRIVLALSVNGDIMIRSILLTLGFTLFVAFGAAAGDITLAANAILLQFLYISAYFLDGFAFAAETLVGQAIGARRRAQFQTAVKLSSAWALVLSLLAALVIWFGREQLIGLFSVNEQVRAEAHIYLLWAALAPVIGVACFQLDGIFIGATRTKDMRNMMIVSFLGYVLALFAFTAAFGNHGLWAALMAFFVLRALTLLARYPALERAAFGRPTP